MSGSIYRTINELGKLHPGIAMPWIGPGHGVQAYLWYGIGPRAWRRK
jgi:hypothetical protein